MPRRLAGVSLVLALAACSPVTTGTSGGRGDDGIGEDDDAEESTTDSAMESGEEGSAEQSGDDEEDDDCVVGAEGCHCTPGGGCDPGLTCDLGICVPAPGDGDGDPTTGDGDADPTTGDGDADPTTGDGDSNVVCQLDDWCSEPDLDACVCEGCWNDGYCTDDEDCICPDCMNVSACNGENCIETGNCFPYWESCNCNDCADHPLCG